MSIPGSVNPLFLGASGQAGGAGAYEIQRSLRFNSSDSAYLSYAVPSGTSTTFTASLWIKRSSISATYKHFLFTSNTANSGAGCGLGWTDGNAITVYNGAHNTTTAVYRDVSAWYYITLSVNAGTATLYVNGVQQVTGVTGFQLNGTAYIGRYITNAYYFDGYMADIYFIDGQALTPSSFTETDVNGVLQPKAFSGSYGTNGFHLPFSDNSTAAALGTDTSGNSNTWTVNNISVTAGAGNDSLVDSPTNYGTDTGVGGEVRGNYCTWNPIRKPSTGVATNGNLEYASSSGGMCGTFSMPSGKWYWEITRSAAASFFGVGIVRVSSAAIVSQLDDVLGNAPGEYSYRSDALKVDGDLNSASSYGASYTTGDVIGIAFDADTGALSFYKNGVSQGTAFTGLTGTFCPAIGHRGTTVGHAANFGQRPFAYTAPSGFKALCTANLPTPLIANGATAMDVKLYTGNGSTQTISGLNFSPDLVWIKERNNATSHCIFDSVRGTGKVLLSNLSNEEVTTTALSAFNSDGFSLLTPNTGDYAVGDLNDTYAAWCWDAGTSTVTNTQGSITSQVRANASAGFSVVTYTGTGANATVGHGLGVAPSMIIVKARTAVRSWPVYHASTGANAYTYLDGTFATVTSNAVMWQGTAPTSTVFSVGTYAENNSTYNYVAYCFAPVAGYSSGFSFTGNGSADGSFVYLGFRPRLILLKCSSTTGNWTLLDTAREGYNVDNEPLYPNLSNAEGTTDLLDITSNGFKLRSTDASVNASADAYIGFAWAEVPFAYSRAR